MAEARRRLRWLPSPGWLLPLAMTTISALACRQPPVGSESQVPRGLETRVVESTGFGRCQSLGSLRGELRPVDCRAPLDPAESRKLLALSEPGRGATSEERTLAGAAAVALSPGVRTIERAIASLTSAPGAGSAEAPEWLALGALQHARARATGNPAYLVDALEATYRALEMEPESRAARFNRAVIEADLGLCRQARDSWREYFAADSSSEWADEGRIRYRSLPCREPSPAPASSGSAPSDPRERDPLFEETVEDLLPRWLDGSREAPGADAPLLRRMSERASRLAADAGDPWLTELVDELRRNGSDPAYLQAVRRYVRGRQLFQGEDYLASRRFLTSARPILEDRDSALLPWCELWLAGIDVNLGRFTAAGRRLGRLAAEPRVQRSPMLAGRVSWAMGLAAIRAGRLQAAYDRYSEAERAFEKGGYLTLSASVHMLKAEALAELGFAEESWRDRVSAMRALQSPDPHFMLRNALLDGATVAGEQGAFRAAGGMLDEVRAIAEEDDDRATATETLLFRAENLLDAGATAEASRAFARALEATRTLSQEVVAERFQAYARLGLWATGALQGARGLSDLDGIIRYFAGKGPQSLELWALRVKARLAMEDGREALARQTVKDAIGEVRRTQRQLREESFELRHWEMAQAVFDDAVRLAIDSAAPVEALEFLEEARDLTGGTARALPFESCALAEPGKTYPLPGAAGSIVLAFGVVGDDLVWWRIDGDRCLFGRRDARRSRTAARDLQSSMRSGNVAPETLDGLYEELLADPLRGAPANVTLRIVPDRFLLRVPFAALRNPVTGKRLVEERALSFHQDLESALRVAGIAPSASSRKDWSVLAVGDPAFDRSSLPWLARLPGARTEAERVAASYAGRSKLLLGEDATLMQVRDGLRGREVLQLAVHALTSPGGANDGLVLASEGAVGGSSGLTPVRDLAPAIPPGLELVVLSGCSTLGTTPTRSSGLAGLARPFISRGVPAVVGTLWPVSDDVLRDLMIRFHAGLLQGASASEALREAQLALLANSPDGSGFDWAAVQLYGELPAVDARDD